MYSFKLKYLKYYLPLFFSYILTSVSTFNERESSDSFNFDSFQLPRTSLITSKHRVHTLSHAYRLLITVFGQVNISNSYYSTEIWDLIFRNIHQSVINHQQVRPRLDRVSLPNIKIRITFIILSRY